MSRYLPDVIDQIIDVIPEDYPSCEFLKAELEEMKDSYTFAAPEAAPMWWHELSMGLYEWFQDEDSTWVRKIQLILQGRDALVELADKIGEELEDE